MKQGAVIYDAVRGMRVYVAGGGSANTERLSRLTGRTGFFYG